MIKVGCCGWGCAMSSYFNSFPVIELQTTFYKLPKLKTAQRWRKAAPKSFEFVVKAFQGVTHPPKSPTWRKFGQPLRGAGYLKPTRTVEQSWKKTLEICRALQSSICLIQLPASFKDTKENLRNAEKFLSSASKEIKIAIELRGWSDRNIKRICKKFSLIDCCDPFARMPLLRGPTAYFRLHGSPPGPRLYNYSYTRKDLENLKQKLSKLKARKIYCMFNNGYSMVRDAKRFQNMMANL